MDKIKIKHHEPQYNIGDLWIDLSKNHAYMYAYINNEYKWILVDTNCADLVPIELQEYYKGIWGMKEEHGKV